MIKYIDPTIIPMNFKGPEAELLPSLSEVLGSKQGLTLTPAHGG